MAKKKDLGTRIRELRLTNNMTQAQVAEKISVSPTYLSKIENNRLDPGKGPSERVIKKLARNLTDKIHFEEVYEELMFLAGKVPETFKKEVLERKTNYRLLFSQFLQETTVQDFTLTFRELQKQINLISIPLADFGETAAHLTQGYSETMEHVKFLANDLATNMARIQFNLVEKVCLPLKSVSSLCEQFQKAMLPNITACNNLIQLSSHWDLMKVKWLPNVELSNALANLKLYQDYVRGATVSLTVEETLEKETVFNLAVTGIGVERYTDSLKSAEFFQQNTEYIYDVESRRVTGGNLPEMIDGELHRIDPSLVGLRRGSWDAFHSASRDGLGQSVHSMRQLLFQIIRLPSDEEVMNSSFYDPKENQGKITRSMRINCILGDEKSARATANATITSIIRIANLFCKYEHTQQQSTSNNRENIRAILCAAEAMIYYLLVNRSKRGS